MVEPPIPHSPILLLPKIDSGAISPIFVVFLPSNSHRPPAHDGMSTQVLVWFAPDRMTQIWMYVGPHTRNHILCMHISTNPCHHYHPTLPLPISTPTSLQYRLSSQQPISITAHSPCNPFASNSFIAFTSNTASILHYSMWATCNHKTMLPLFLIRHHLLPHHANGPLN